MSPCRRCLALLGLVLLAWGVPARAEEIVTVEGPADVQGLLCADTDGDGIDDLLLIAGRTVLVYRGRKGTLPEPKPTWEVTLSSGAAFVDAAADAKPDRPAIYVLGRDGLTRVDLTSGEAAPVEGIANRLGWGDSRKVAFADFVLGPDEMLLPNDVGFCHARFGPRGLDIRCLEATPFLEVEAPGAFLEDMARVVDARDHIRIGAPPEGAAPGAPPVFWTLAGREVVIFFGDQRQTIDLSFLPLHGVRLLADIDGDGAPEVMHHDETNQESTYAFYDVQPLKVVDGVLQPPPPLGAQPTTPLRLDGFQLDPRYVDLNGDKRLDFVVTTIPIDVTNVASALMGHVRASTRAFLHRDVKAGGGFFPTTPDASIESSIRVAIRFTQAGTIDIRRSFTILVDGNFDGDDRKDLCIRTADDTLRIHRGTARGVWEPVLAAEDGKGENWTVPIPPLGAGTDIEGYVADLDGDGKDEIVLLYRRVESGQDRVRVLDP